MTPDRTRLVEKIRKLLALSSSDNEHEAAAAAALAQKMLSQYNLSMSDIPKQDARSIHAQKKTAKTRQRLEKWAYLLASVVSRAFDCDYFHDQCGQTVFVGVGADSEVCAWTYSYLYKTLLRMGSAYLRGPQCRRLRTSKSRNAARADYLKGAVLVIRVRLRKQSEATPVTESAIVPLKKAAIKAELPEDLTSKPLDLKSQSRRASDLDNGLRDGQSVPLSTPLNAGQCPGLSE